MNFHFISDLFRPKPSHKEVRYITATGHENTEARLRRETVANDLRCAVGDLNEDERDHFRTVALTYELPPLTDKKREGRA